MTHRTASSLSTPLFPGPQGKKKYPEFFLLMSFTYLGKVEPPKFYFSRVVSFSGPEWALPGAGQRKLPLHQECLAPHPKQSTGFQHQHWFCPKPPGLVCDFRPVTIALFLSLWAPLYFLCERTGYIKSAVLFQEWSGFFFFFLSFKKYRSPERWWLCLCVWSKIMFKAGLAFVNIYSNSTTLWQPLIHV